MINKKLLDNLKLLFDPKSVAVIGASQNSDKLGYHVMKSLTEGRFQGRVVPINPKPGDIMGLASYPSLAKFEGPIDLAVIVLPAKLVPGIFEECINKGIKGIVLITAGFKEIDDPNGELRQKELKELANRAGIPVIGPNTFGMINLHNKLNASFTPEFSWLDKGHVALVSQSGGVSHLLGFMGMKARLGISKIVGLGNRLNVGFAEIILYLMDDPDTHIIMVYLEGIEKPRRLLEVAAQIRAKKPIIAYKTGLAEAGNRASMSHTGSLAGKHEIYAGAFKQAGILCVNDSETLLDVVRALTICSVPKDNKVAILSAQAGPAMAACDLCEVEGLEIGGFGQETQRVINHLLPPLALRTNPVDMGPAWYDASAIAGIVRAVLKDESISGVLLIMMFASANRETISGLYEFLLDWKQKKPILSCFVAPPGIWDAQISQMEAAGALINFPTPERAAKAMASLWRYAELTTAAPGS